ncbi:MAG TPA: DUF5719 family protein [Actinomycetota bacterium]|nr:DUF5719 family protein [Actinomycetota bacterium]
MTIRAQAPLAVLFVAMVVAAGIAANGIGRATPADAPAATVSSSTWVCPHGGDESWTGSVTLMNPGDADVDVRISTIGRTRSGSSGGAATGTTVPARGQVIHDVPVTDRGAATVVDAFGGWIGVAWTVSSDDPAGLGAEPCAPGGDRRWFAADPGTPEGDDAFLVVANPYDVEAIVDVALFTADRPPIRPEEWTDLEIGPRRSVALAVNRAAEGERALVADVTAQVGRVAVASFVTSRDGGIRSALATPSFVGPTREFPVAGGAGATTLSIGVPSEIEARFDATLLTGESPQAAGGLTDPEQAGPTAQPYDIPTDGAASIHLDVETSDAIVAALRADGRAVDDGATAGAADPAEAWVVPSTVMGEPSFPEVVVVNPGSRDASVTLEHLASGEAITTREQRIAVPAGATVVVPQPFLAAAPDAAILARSDGEGIVVLGASASLGIEGFARYALVLGLPLPDGL